MQKYIKKADPVTAIQLSLDTEGIVYEKWGNSQNSKAGDWIVKNGFSVYIIDGQSFARTYEQVSEGRYVKTAPVWASVASEDGVVSTREGSTDYKKGDYIVSNDVQFVDTYAISKEKFESMYVSA